MGEITGDLQGRSGLKKVGSVDSGGLMDGGDGGKETEVDVDDTGMGTGIERVAGGFGREGKRFCGGGKDGLG